jgi:cell division initiation protein
VKLTPLDIRHKEFRRGMRGYSDEDVDVFLDEVADEFERLFQENIEARERIEHLVEQIRHFEALKETLQKTLVSAQQQADEMKANARKEAELIIKDAEIKGRDLVSESYTEKQRVQQALTKLKQVEEDFRFKFRSLLEAHINLLAEDESSEDRRRFRNLVSDVESDAVPSSPDTPAAPEVVAPWSAPAYAQSAGVSEPATREPSMPSEPGAYEPSAPSEPGAYEPLESEVSQTFEPPAFPEPGVQTASEDVSRDGSDGYGGARQHTLDDNPFADIEREAALLEAQDAPVFDADSFGPSSAPQVDDLEEGEPQRFEIPAETRGDVQVLGSDSDEDRTGEESEEVSVRRFRFGRRVGDQEARDGDGPRSSQSPEDRDFEW